MSGRSSLSDRRRQFKSLKRRDGLRCRFCLLPLTRDTATIDHWVPRARGGSNQLENLVLACGPCNQSKKTMTGDEFLALADEWMRKLFRELAEGAA